MNFGVFDHIDSSVRRLAEEIEERLKLAEPYDRLGFHAPHIAEHHSTPFGVMMDCNEQHMACPGARCGFF